MKKENPHLSQLVGRIRRNRLTLPKGRVRSDIRKKSYKESSRMMATIET